MKIWQETICRVRDTKNGASPLWCYGSTAIMRLGDKVVATVPANDNNVLPLADRHIELYAKTGDGPWQKIWHDMRFTREPAPILRRDDQSIWISLNPSEKDVPIGQGIEYGPAIPTLALFDLTKQGEPTLERLPLGDYYFMDHSYRGMAIDRQTGDLFITWQYVEGEGKHCFLLRTPKGDVTEKLEFPVRACYHNLAVKDKKAYVLAISDICEPVAEWAEYKYAKTGVRWDYDFRNLYFTYCNDITTGEFAPAALIDSREETCGQIRNLDLFVADSGVCYLVYEAKRIWHDFMRDRFFPEVRFDTVLTLCAVKDGNVLWRKELDAERETDDRQNTKASYSVAFFQRADGSLGLLFNKTGSNGTGMADGWYLSRGELAEHGNPAFSRLDVSCPPNGFHTARPRCGALPSDVLDVLTVDGEDVVYLRIPAV